jgi:sugar phosphate isomerase/epimerase
VDPRLSVSAVSSWSWTFEDDLRFWGASGIDHVGLSFRKLEEAGLDRAVQRIVDADVTVSNLVELGWWELASPSTWAAQSERLLAAVEVAARVGGCLVLTTGPAGSLDWDDAAEALAAALAPARASADAAGVALTIENTGPLRLDLSFVTTLRDALDVARRVGTGVCMEVNSCFAERDLLATVGSATGLLRHVQVSDFVIGSLCTPDRAVPGDGDVPLTRIIDGVIAAGYAGVFELELVGPRIEDEGYASAITRGVAHLDEILARSAQPSA